MEDQETDSRQDAITRAASDAYFAADSSVMRLAEAHGAEIRERPVWPGSFSKTRYAEPLAGIRAAQTVRRSADRVAGDYVRHARVEGIGWREIGGALGLAEDGQRTGYDLAVVAYEQVTGEPDVFREVSFHYSCPACGQGISDRGPYESHPEDNERGHAEDCTRLAADVAAWQAQQDAEDAEWEAWTRQGNLTEAEADAAGAEKHAAAPAEDAEFETEAG